MADRRLSLEERSWALTNFLKNGARFVFDHWRDKFPSDPPSYRTLKRLKSKLLKIGSLKNRPKKPRKTTNSEENQFRVFQQIYENNNEVSVRCLARELDLKKSTVHLMLKENRMHLYVPRIVQQLTE